jgi:hypothetical protein
MKADRDTLLLLITFVPAGFVVYCFISWHTTGVWPMSMPNIAAPAIPLPGWLTSTFVLPPSVQHQIDSARSNWVVMTVGLLGGLCLGIMFIGTLADLVRWLGRAIFSRPAKPPVEMPVQSEEVPEIVSYVRAAE